MSEEGRIDDIFKQKLSNHSVAPRGEVWDKIDQQLDNNNKGGGYWKWLPLLLLLLAGVAGAFYAINDSEAESTILSEQIHEEQESPTTETAQQIEIMVDKTVSSKPDNKEPNRTPNAESASEVEKPADNKIENTLPKYDSTPASSKTPVLGAAPILHTSVANSTPQVEISQPSEPVLDYASEFSAGFFPEENQIETSLMLMEPKLWNTFSINPLFNDDGRNLSEMPVKGHPWTVGIYYEANWNYKNVKANIGQSTSLDSLVSSESTTFTSGYGINVSYQFKNRIRISTGVEYATWCRSASYPVSIPQPVNTYPGFGSETYKEEFAGSTGDQVISIDNTELGFTENVALAPEPVDFDLDVHECYSFLSIPLRLGYDLNLGTWHLIPEVGFSYNRIVESEIEGDASTQFNSLVLRRESTYKRDIFSFTGNLSLERDLTTSLKFGVMGSYKNWITPIYTTEAFETKPYMLSARAILWYNF